MRGGWLAAAGVTATLSSLYCTVAARATEGAPELALEVVADGLPALSASVHAGDHRLFLLTLDGRILVLEHGSLRAEPFLDLRSTVSSGGESGLLGLAFHPSYAENGIFFVFYSDLEGRAVLARYRRASEDPSRADPGSAAILLALEEPAPSHFGGQLSFGPDGYLYVATGDGGLRYDPTCNAQRLDRLHGKLLRLDIDHDAGVAPYYTAPVTNPFAGDPASRAEIWLYGLRNPWRFHIDRATGDLFIGDVGEGDREEIDLAPGGGAGGLNFGWARLEGTVCLEVPDGCADAPPCDSGVYTAPILEYEHAGASCHAVIAGPVYRGAAIPQLYGTLLYGDYCSGRIRGGRRQDDGTWAGFDLGLALSPLTSFGEDVAGEVYVTTRFGVLARIVAAVDVQRSPCSPDELTLCLDAARFRARARFAAPGATLEPAHAVAISDDTGYFWFFRPENVELVTKVLDGCPTALPAHWLFVAGLTDLETEVEVTDLETGVLRRYRSPAGEPFRAIQDNRAFACP